MLTATKHSEISNRYYFCQLSSAEKLVRNNNWSTASASFHPSLWPIEMWPTSQSQLSNMNNNNFTADVPDNMTLPGGQKRKDKYCDIQHNRSVKLTLTNKTIRQDYLL